MERKLNQKSDQELVVLFKEGNDRAFEEIIARYSQKMRTAISGFTYDYATREDIYQDCCINAFLALRKGKFQMNNLAAWLRTIAKNLAINHYRHAKRDRIDLMDNEGYMIIGKSFSSKDPDPEMCMLHTEYLESISSMLKELIPIQEEVLRYHYLEEYTFNEIAKINDYKNSPITYRTRSRRAIKQLREFHIHS